MPYDENRFKLKQSELLGIQSKEKGLEYLKQRAGISENIEKNVLDPKSMLFALSKSTLSKTLPLPSRLGGSIPENISSNLGMPQISVEPGLRGALVAGGSSAAQAAGSEALGAPMALAGSGIGQIARTAGESLPARLVSIGTLGKQIEISMKKFALSKDINKINLKSIWEGIKRSLEFGKVTSSTRANVIDNLGTTLGKVNQLEEKLENIKTKVQGIPQLEEKAKDTIETMEKVKNNLLSNPPAQEILDLSRFDLGEDAIKFKSLTPQARGILGREIINLRNQIFRSGESGRSYIKAINRTKTGGIEKTAKTLGIAGSTAVGLAAIKKLLSPKEESSGQYTP